MDYNYTKLEAEQLEFITVGPSDELKNGERLFVEVDDLVIAVFNIAGEIYAILDECSHDNNSLEDGDLNGYQVTCPRHGARFDVRSGKATALPAVVNIPAYPTRVVDGQIEIGLPLDE
jgi:3-phenylpropionate/trans-cinnamate dioxygenase ferredoxin subunit